MNIFGQEFLPNVPNYYLYLAIGMIIFIIIYKNRKKIFGKKEEEYEAIDLQKEVKGEIKALFDVSSKKIFRNKKLLRVGYNIIGRINRVMIFNWSKKITQTNPMKQIAKETLKTTKDGEESSAIRRKAFLGFELIKNTFIGKIKYLFGFGKFYFLVDKEIITDSASEYIINPNSQHHRYFKCLWIFSTAGKEAILNVADRITLTETLQALANFIPRMTFLETKTAKLVLKAQELSKIEREKYLSRIETLEKE